MRTTSRIVSMPSPSTSPVSADSTETASIEAQSRAVIETTVSFNPAETRLPNLSILGRLKTRMRPSFDGTTKPVRPALGVLPIDDDRSESVLTEPAFDWRPSSSETAVHLDVVPTQCPLHWQAGK